MLGSFVNTNKRVNSLLKICLSFRIQYFINCKKVSPFHSINFIINQPWKSDWNYKLEFSLIESKCWCQRTLVCVAAVLLICLPDATTGESIWSISNNNWTRVHLKIRHISHVEEKNKRNSMGKLICLWWPCVHQQLKQSFLIF